MTDPRGHPEIRGQGYEGAAFAVAGIALSTTAVRPPGTWRYNVEGLHPIRGAIVWSRECPPQAGSRLKRSGNLREEFRAP